MIDMDYASFFNQFIELANQEFLKWEKLSEEPKNLHDLARHLPALISINNTVGYLRGQDGCFLDFGPRTEQQNHFYEQEDLYEKRLSVLISKVMNSPEKDYYEKRLHSYFSLVRTNKDSEIF